jgi:hypothetical protein
MEPSPNPQSPSPYAPLRKEPVLSPVKEGVRPEIKPGKADGDSYRGTRSGRAYVPLKPEIAEKPEQDSAQQREIAGSEARKRVPVWIFIFIVAGAVLGIAVWTWHYFASQTQNNLLILTVADVNQQLTQSARSSLLQGKVPAFLSGANTEILNRIKSGEFDLAERNLGDSPQTSGTMVHVYISINGQAAVNDVLTSERSKTTVFPISRNGITRLHYVVDSAGPTGTVTLSVRSNSGAMVTTGPLSNGVQADLLVTER